MRDNLSDLMIVSGFLALFFAAGFLLNVGGRVADMILPETQTTVVVNFQDLEEE